MIESLYQLEKYQLLHRNAPLLEERELYLSNMLDRGVSKTRVQAIANILLHTVQILELEQMRAVTEGEIKWASGLWLTLPKAHLTRKCGPTSSGSFQREAMRWFRFHNAIDTTAYSECPFDAALADYLSHLACRQLSQNTIVSQRSAL